MNNTQLIAIVLGLVGAIALIVLGVMARRIGDLAESVLAIAGPGLIAWRNQAESELARYGDQLAPVHELLLTIKPYTDSPDDQLYKRIAGITGWPVDVVAAVGARIWAEAEDLTDGDAGDGDPVYSGGLASDRKAR